MKRSGTALAFGIASIATAQPLEFVIDPAQSSIDMSITIDLGTFGGDSDSNSSSLSGFVTASLDDVESPSQVSLHDFQAVMDSDLDFSWEPAFLSTASATLVGGLMQYASPGVIQGPVPVAGGNFEFFDVPVIVGGVLNVNYDIFLIGAGSESIDLSTLGESVTPISGSVSTTEGIVTIMNSVVFSGSQPLVLEGTEVGQVVFVGTATMVATATAPDCPADFTGDGELDFFDISAFLTAFSAMDPAGDFNGDGEWDFFDISAFLTAFSSGCP